MWNVTPTKAASLNKVIEQLTGNTVDPTFQKMFFMTYLSFSSPQLIFKKLMERYDGPTGPKSEGKSYPKSPAVQAQVGEFIKMWVDSNWEDIDTLLLKQIRQFSKQKLSRDGYDSIAKHILASIEKRVRDPQQNLIW